MNSKRPVPTAVAPRLEAIRPLGTKGRIAIVIPVVVGAIIAAPSGFGLYFFIPYAGVGTLLVIRRPRTSIGWILLALAWAFALVTLSVDATAGQFVDGSLGPVECHRRGRLRRGWRRCILPVRPALDRLPVGTASGWPLGGGRSARARRGALSSSPPARSCQ